MNMGKLIVDMKEGKVVPICELSDIDIKAIEVALYHQWHRITDDDGNAVSCSQEMADTTYKMMSLFEALRKEIKIQDISQRKLKFSKVLQMKKSRIRKMNLLLVVKVEIESGFYLRKGEDYDR